MTQSSLPWQGIITGDAGPYSAVANWQTLWRYTLHGLRANVGPLIDSGSAPNVGLQVQATSPGSAAVDVLTGSALVAGSFYLNDATETLSIAANVSGNPRIDTVVLTADYTAQTVRLEVLTGTPAATPAPPTLTQVVGTEYQIPLADIAVANGFVTIGNGDITSRHEWANAADGVYLKDILNNSGVTLETGDVVIWDTTADRAVKTTTTEDDPNIAGVWVGRTNNAGYGRILVEGVGFVNVGSAVTRGNGLCTGTTATEAKTTIGDVRSIGVALETTSGAGLCLSYVKIQRPQQGFLRYTYEVASGNVGPTYTTGADRTVPLNTEVYNGSGLGSLAANQVTIQPGVYFVHGSASLLGGGSDTDIRLKLYDTTGTVELLKGMNSTADANTYGWMHLYGIIRITTASALELRLVTSVNTGAGAAVGDGTNEIYAVLEFERKMTDNV